MFTKLSIRLIFLIITLTIFRSNNCNSQESSIAVHKGITNVSEIDSIYYRLKQKGIDTIILFFQDGFSKTGLIISKTGSIESGFAFSVVDSGNVTIKKIKKKHLRKTKPFELSIKNRDVICYKTFENKMTLSHDLDVLFHFEFGLNSCSKSYPLSTIASTGNYDLSRFFEMYSELYYLTIKKVHFPSR